MMSVAEMLDGTVKESRMIVLKSIVMLMVLCFTCQTHAKGKIYSGLNVYTPTVVRWDAAIQNAAFDSITWVWDQGLYDRRHKNKSRDSILMVPASAIPDDITLIVWFHGCGGFSQRTFSNRIIPQMERIVSKGHSVAISLPEMPWSVNTQTKCGRQGKVWRRPGELEKYVESLKDRLRTWSTIQHGVPLGTVRLVFVGHSAGGSALSSAANEGSLCKMKPESIIWSDASYGHWLDYAWHACIRNCNTDLYVLVRKWDKPYRNAERVMKYALHRSRKARVKYKVLNRKQWSHGKIGNNVFKIANLFPPGC